MYHSRLSQHCFEVVYYLGLHHQSQDICFKLFEKDRSAEFVHEVEGYGNE